MKINRVLLGLACMLACGTTPVSAWWWTDAPTYRSYTSTTFTIRPYNAFSDLSCTVATNGSLPISLLGGCGNNGGCNTGCAPRCGYGGYQPPTPYYAAPYYPPCWTGWPSLYNNGGCQTCAYPPAMYYPQAAYYPPPPAPSGPRGR